MSQQTIVIAIAVACIGIAVFLLRKSAIESYGLTQQTIVIATAVACIGIAVFLLVIQTY
jgi:hypothetical protein